MIEPQHTVDIGGVERRLRYRIADWFRAGRACGTDMRSGYGVPLASMGEMVPMILFVGLFHEDPKLTLEKAAELITFEEEDAIFEACVKAIYDYDPVSKKKLEALAEATKAAGLQNQELTMLVELIRSITTTESGPSPSITAISQPKKPKILRSAS